EFGDVGQHGHLYRLDEAVIGGQVVGGLGEDRVGAGLDAGQRALDRGVHSVRRNGVGASDQVEVGVGARVGGRLDTVGHFLGADDFLARAMPAALGANLVFDVAGRCAELDQAFHRAGNIECRRPEAGVDVDQ